MNLLISSIINETKTLMKNDIKLMAIGDINKIPKTAKNKLDSVIEKTKNNAKMSLILAISYSGRWEIINAVKKIIKNNVDANEINEHLFEQYLDTKNVPDPELVIRTSGEHRISNFLLWQIAYSSFISQRFFGPISEKRFY